MADTYGGAETARTETPGTRRGALATLLGGVALGLGAATGASSGADARKGKKQRRSARRREKRKGKSKGGKGVGAALPSVQYAERTETADENGVWSTTVQCPEGYLPISAGFYTAVPNPNIIGWTPQPATRSWQIEINGAVEHDEFTAIAVCVAASDDTSDDDVARDRNRRKKGGNRKKTR